MHSLMCYRWIIAIDVVDVVVASEEEPTGARRGEIGRRSRSDGQSNALVFHASNATQTSTGTGACALLLHTTTLSPHNSYFSICLQREAGAGSDSSSDDSDDDDDIDASQTCAQS